jgi:ATP-dependent DNA helicase RecQ
MIENNFITPTLANDLYNFLRAQSKVSSLVDVLTKIKHINRPKLIKCLELFEKAGIIEVCCDLHKLEENHKVKVNLIKPSLLFLSWKIDFNKQQRLFNQSIAKLTSMIELCSSDCCRMKYILDYFGESSDPCGKCDYCRVD